MSNPNQNGYEEIIEFRHIFAPYVWSDLREGKCVGSGWTELLVELFRSLGKIERASPGSIRIVQVKEKFGELRVYLGKSHRDASSLIDMATAASRTVCEGCGRTSTIKDRQGWYTTLCDHCFEGRSRR